MKYRRTTGLAALIAVMALPASAFAEPGNPFELTGYVKVEQVTTDASGEQLVERVEPQVVVPGDRLIFGTRFVNHGPAPIERIVVSNPVPAQVSVTGEIDPGALVSVDGGKAWGTLADLEIVDAEGRRRAALPADITHVRWILSHIAPGESGQVEFPAMVR